MHWQMCASIGYCISIWMRGGGLVASETGEMRYGVVERDVSYLDIYLYTWQLHDEW